MTEANTHCLTCGVELTPADIDYCPKHAAPWERDLDDTDGSDRGCDRCQDCGRPVEMEGDWVCFDCEIAEANREHEDSHETVGVAPPCGW